LVNEYNPDRAPDPEAWKGSDEMDLMELVIQYHDNARIRMPNARAHAALHVMVENQVALAEQTPVADAVIRLTGEGLGRHDALHAVGSVLLTHMNNAAATNTPISRDAYFEDVRALTAESWYRDYSLDAGED
jgi:hypothetical protein